MTKSMIYTFGGVTKPLDRLHNGKPFFRKQAKSNEITIAQILRKHPHPNIVTFYTISPKHNYIDMELLKTSHDVSKQKVLKILAAVKDHLQSLGIMYIDWKVDQTGVAADGTLKLFDFDASGVIDLRTKNWIIDAPSYWSYHQATARGITDPFAIDDFAFTLIYPPKNFKPVEMI